MITEEPHFPCVDYDLPMPQDDDDLNDEITRLAGHINAAAYRFLKLLAESGTVVIKALEAAFDAVHNQSTGPERAERETVQQDEDEEWSVVYECTADESDEHTESPETTPRRCEDDFEPEIESDTELASTRSKNDSAETFSPIESMDSYEQLRADALVLMSEHLLATMDQGVSSLAAGDKYQVMIHIDANSIDSGETLNHEGDRTHCYLDGGPFLCPDTVRRLACDAGIVTVLEDTDGNILNIGRKSRTVPSPVRRALNLRDQGCRFPSCTTESRYAEAHHIEHWCNGGETSLENLILICHHHQALLHEGKYRVFVDDDQQLVFVNLLNETIEAALYPQFPDQENDAQMPLVIEGENRALGLAIDAGTCGTQGLGERMYYIEEVCVLQESDPSFSARFSSVGDRHA